MKVLQNKILRRDHTFKRRSLFHD